MDSMSIPPLTGPDLTAARHLCHHLGVGGHTGGSFIDALLRCLEAADAENRERLLSAYPEYRRAVFLSTTYGAVVLAEIVKASDRLRRYGQGSPNGDSAGSPPEIKDGTKGPATEVALLVAASGGVPDAVTVLRHVREKLERFTQLGMGPTEFIDRYLQQLETYSTKGAA